MNFEDLQGKVEELCGLEHFEPDLDRFKKCFCEEIIELKKHSQIITIAGTNGKGETAHFLNRLLSKEAQTTLWTSPHILSLSERFKNKEDEIDESKLEQLIESVEKRMKSKKVQLSYYEFLFGCFILWSHKISPDYIVLEVGLGGRLDATNVIDCDLALLTSIGRDHQAFLGNRYDLILNEKLGIVKTNSKLITNLQLEYLKQKTSSKYKDATHLTDLGITSSSDSFSIQNKKLAAYGYFLLTNNDHSLAFESIKNEYLPFRGQTLQKNQLKISLFGSHNLLGLRKLVQFLEHDYYNKNHYLDMVVAGFSTRDAKDLQDMMVLLKKYCTKRKIPLIFSPFDHPRAFNNLEQFLQTISLEVDVEAYEEIFKKYMHSRKNILLLGSYYFIGNVVHLLTQTSSR